MHQHPNNPAPRPTIAKTFVTRLVVAFAAFASFMLASPAHATTCPITPNSGSDVVISATCQYDAGTFDFTGGNFTINSGVTVTASSKTGTPGPVNIIANNITVNGTLTADNQGFGSGGPGGGSGLLAGGYGGNGGGTDGISGLTYGSVTNPTAMGSQGGTTTTFGGGAIGLTTTGTLTVASTGIVSANGQFGSTTDKGGGSGGSILINAGTLSGSGIIRANGGAGNNQGRGGGGGRIAVFYTTDSSTLVSGNKINAFGGTGSTGQKGGAGSLYLFHTGVSTNGDVIFDNTNQTSVAYTTQVTIASQTYDNITIRNGALYAIPSGFTLALAGGSLTGGGTAPLIEIRSGGTFDPGVSSFSFTGINAGIYGALASVTALTLSTSFASFSDTASFPAGLADLTVGSGGTYNQIGTATFSIGGTFLVQSGGTVTHSANTSTKANVVDVSAANITINSGATVSVDGKGYTSSGPGAGSARVGGGHGGDAGGVTGITGKANDSVTVPADLGSNGGNTVTAGGGLVKLVASGTLTVSTTTFSANGSAGSTTDIGGGAGGTIYLQGGAIAGTATIAAKGGAGTNQGHGGGGGRIAVFYTSSTAAWTYQPFGGTVSTGTPGGSGTVYVKSAAAVNGDLILDNNNLNGSTTQQISSASQTYDNVTIKNGAKYVLNSGFTLAVAPGGALTGAAGATRPIITVNSGGEFDFPAATSTLNTLDLTVTGTIGVVSNLTLLTSTLTASTASVFAAGLNDFTVGSGGKFTQTGTSTFALTGTLTVQASGTLTHAANTTTRANVLDVSASAIDLQTNSTVTANNLGFTSGGSGAGSSTAGASYGGNGGGASVATYGSVTDPTDLGSNTLGNTAGGGAIKLVSSGNFTINGTVSANGQGGLSTNYGGGSGGSVILQADGTLFGSGTVNANGGNGNNSGNGGGGGRIALTYGADSSTLITGNKLLPLGGTNASWGGAGTVYVFHTGISVNGDLRCDDNSLANAGNTTQLASSTQTYDNITIRGGCKYVIPSGATLNLASGGSLTGGGTVLGSLTVSSGGTLSVGSALNVSSLAVIAAGSITGNPDVTIGASGTFTQATTSLYTFNTLTVQNGGTLNHLANTTTKASVLNITAGIIDIQTGAVVNLDSLGYSATHGFTGGAGTTCLSPTGGGGGAHGGDGGRGSTCGPGGAAYDSPTGPTELGSGGGGANFGGGGAGGGAVKLVATGTFTLNGSITAGGGTGGQDGGGGAGGSIWIVAGTLAWSPAAATVLSAIGASNSSAGGGGAGGRIAITYGTDTSNIITGAKFSVRAGTSSQDFGGGAGTIYTKAAAAANGDLIVDNGTNTNVNLASTPQTSLPSASQTYDNVTIKNNGRYLITTGKTLTVVSGGTITGGGATRPSLTVNSGGTFNFPNASSTLNTLDLTASGTIGVVTDLTLVSSTLTATSSVFTAGLADLTVGSGGKFSQTGTADFALTGTLTIQNTGNVTHAANTTTKANVVSITAANIDIQTGGTVNVDALGYIAVNGPSGGAGTTCLSPTGGGGGAHGGDGGRGSTCGTGGAAYDSLIAPIELGAGGGSANIGSGGAGGGAVKLVASGTLTLNGSISANGGAPGQDGGGGGGGSIWIDAGTLAGTPAAALVFTANGSNNGSAGGGGGGGRIAITYGSDSSNIITGGKYRAQGGTSSQNFGGGAGTIYTKAASAANGDLTIDNGTNTNTNLASTTQTASPSLSQTYDNLTVKNNGRYLIPGSRTLTVASGGTITGGGTTRPSITVNSGGTFNMQGDGVSLNTLNVTNSGTVTGVTDLTLASSTFTQGGTFPSLNSLTINSGGIFVQGKATTQSITTLTVNASGTYTHGTNDVSTIAKVDVSAATVTVAATGSITANGLGLTSNATGGAGTGGGVSSGGSGGGGYGGAGGTGSGAGGTGGSVNGSSTSPASLGFAGGAVGATLAGQGGGWIKIVATTSITNNGSITSNGAAGVSSNSGGGSGGTIFLDVTSGTWAGNGTMTANGAAGQSSLAGCGGGGRIAIIYATKTYSGSPTVNGAATGNCATSPRPGSNGSFVETQANPVPTTTSISPTSAIAGGSSFTLTVNGTNFVAGSSVLWNGVSRTTTFVNSTQLTASIPSSDITTAGSATVTVFNPSPGGGTSNGQTFAINNPVPTTSSLSPTNVIAGSGAFTLTVNGTNFVSASVVRWAGSDRTTTFVNANQLTASITGPDVADAGTFSVTVFNPTPGGGTSNGQTFTVNNPVPTTTAITPDAANAGDAGFTITVDGTNFVTTSVVKWAGSARTTTFVNATQLTASINASDIATGGTFSVTVFNPTPGGGTSNAQTFTVSNLVPTTTSISPDNKLAASGGFTLTVNGTNFVSTSVVRWGGTDRTTTFVNSGQITASIPGSDITAAGTVLVTVFNPTPGGGESNSQTFTINNPVPTTTSISPTNKTAGDATFTLTVNGTNFVASSVVRWGGSDRTTTYVSATQLTASIPDTDLASAGTATVTVFDPTPGGGTSNGQTFTINNPGPGTLTTTSISPSSATAGGAAFTLTVNGTGFVSGSVVRWEGNDRTTTFVGATQLTAAIPDTDIATAGTFSVSVFNPSPGGGSSNTQTFTVNNPAPTTTSILPTSATAGDAAFTLTVDGTNFVAGSVVRWDGSDRVTTFVSSAELTAAITATDIAIAGTFAITVFNPTPGGGVSNVQTFTVNNPVPTTTLIAPNAANAGDAAFTLTVTGTNFVPTSVVRWAGSDKTTTFVSATSLTAAIPATDLATGGTFAVTVFNPTPGGGESNAQTFTVSNLVPTTTAVSPTTKAAGDAAFTLTVDGTNFVSTSVVRWEGSDRTTTFVSSTQVTAAIAASDVATNGTYNVTVFNPTPGGGVSNAQVVTVNNPAPTVSSISPDTKQANDPAFTLNVTGTNFVASSVVRWNGSDRTTTYVSPTSLQAAIPSTDLATPGVYNVTVFNPTPGGGTSGAVPFTVTNPPGGAGSSQPPPTPPKALTPTVLGPTSIRWNFQDMSSDETGFEIIDLGRGGVVVATTRPDPQPNIDHLDEVRLTPSTTYCHRAVTAFNDIGSSTITYEQMYPCVTTPAAPPMPPPPPPPPPIEGPPLQVTDTTTSTVTLAFSTEYRQSTTTELVAIQEIKSGMYVAPSGGTLAAFFPASRWLAARLAPARSVRAYRLTAEEQPPFVLSTQPFFQTIDKWPISVTVGNLTDNVQYDFALEEKTSPDAPAVRIYHVLATTDDAFVKLVIDKRFTGGQTVGGTAVLSYRIGITNEGNMTANNVTLEDVIPEGTTYHPGSMTADGNPLTDAADGDVGTFTGTAARWVWATVDPSVSHVVTVQIDEEGGDGTDVVNTSSAICDGCEKAGCGDGALQGEEKCDEGASNGTIGHCNAVCTGIIKCGDGKIEGNEICDGNRTVDFKLWHCNACLSWSKCGNGVVEPQEICDEGANNGKPEHCSNTCEGFVPYCGNFKVETGEQCDEGAQSRGGLNGVPGHCSARCTSCGNGTLDEGEKCDDGSLNGKIGSCNLECTGDVVCGDNKVQGEEVCDGDRVVDFKLWRCNACLGWSKCGNGIQEAGEICDEGALTGKPEHCNAQCSGLVPFCGNAVIEQGEQCDEGAQSRGGSNGLPNHCSDKCSACGDGTVNFEEKCDEGADNGKIDHCNPSCSGNVVCGDGKTEGEEMCDGDRVVDFKLWRCNACLSISKCGNGAVEFGETCDDGALTGKPEHCNAQCDGLVPYCGNFQVERGEQCDEGSQERGGSNGLPNHCPANCIACGDGAVNFGEICDEGPDNGRIDHCNPTCSGTVVCGDKKVEGEEVCEEDKTVDFKLWRCNACLGWSVCGNGKLELGETCDDGGLTGKPEHCNNTCNGQVPYCGNFKVETGEQCDEGSQARGGANGTPDHCTADCKLCGNRVVDSGEKCDDGGDNGKIGSCNPQCSGIVVCGDNKVEGEEICEQDKNVGGKLYRCGACLQWFICGDGKIEGPETCDDGRRNGQQGRCDLRCTGITPICGDGIVAAPEACDDGAANGQVGRCDASCSGPEPLFPESWLIRLYGYGRKKKSPVVTIVPPGVVVPGEEPPGAVPPGTPPGETPPPDAVIEIGNGGAPITTDDPAPILIGYADPFTRVLLLVDGKPFATVLTDARGMYHYTLDATQFAGTHVFKAESPPAVIAHPNAATSVVAALAVANAVGALGATGFLNMMFLLFTQPAMLLDRKGRRPYGTVFNSLRKTPVDLAIVRLHGADGRLHQTKITDARGRYSFFAPAGDYRIDITKSGYVFPTAYMKGVTSDIAYADVLSAPGFTLSKESVVIKDIPVDPTEKRLTPAIVSARKAMHRINSLISAASTLISLAMFVIAPSALTLVILIAQIVLYGLFAMFARPRRPKSHGVIRDAKTGKPLRGAVVRVFDTHWNKLLEMQMTDGRGRYGFLVGKGRYYVAVNKLGYKTMTSQPIDLTTGEKEQIVATDVRLEPEW